MHSFTFNGHSSEEFGIRIERFPDLNRSERKYRSASVAGRNGNIYQMQNAWEEVVVSYQIFAGERAAGAAVTDFTDIVEWLNSADDYAVLTDTYDPAHYRLAVFVDELEVESEWHTFGKATVKFRCRPQRYLTKGWNMLPKMKAGTYTNAGLTAVVDERGIATFSGTASGSTYLNIPLEGSITVTQDMVDSGVYVYLNNTASWSNLATIYFSDSSYITAFTANALQKNSSMAIPQSAVGKTIQQVRVYCYSGYTLSGTIMPQIISESQSVTVESGSSIANPTNHTALPIITLTGSQVIPNLLDLEKSYTYTFDSSGWDHWTDQFLDNTAFYGVVNSQGGVASEIGWYTQASASSKGGTITTKSNSTGTLTFTSWSNMGATVGVGRGVTLTPNSDYTISCTTTASTSKIQAIFFNSESPQSLNGSAIATRSGAGQLQLSFRVPVTCQNVLIMFYQTDGTSGTFSNIMLNSGNTPAQFASYSGETTDSISINDVTLSFNHSGFSTAVIDCEHENFSIDGVNANNKATVIDQYGNLSDEYLQLTKGNNEVNFTANISGASFAPHFWEL